MPDFYIDAESLSWINGNDDDPEDLCLHGYVNVQIGEEALQDDATVSAGALQLLRTLTEDHFVGGGLQMMPCCGHAMYANAALTSVEIVGCDCGIDWTVLHEEDCVKLITQSGAETAVSMEEYRQAVFRFADKVEAFYKACTPKKMPKEKYEREGYAAFWNEWRRRRICE